jgi:hypothetical protein
MYTIELDDAHVRAFINAMDLFARIGIGQLEEIANIIGYNGIYSADTDQIERVRELCVEMKKVLGIPVNGSMGIYGDKVPSQCKIAWDMQCVVRQVVARAEGHGAHSIWHNDPLHCEKSVPLITCTHKET